MGILNQALLIVLVSIAVYTDIKYRKIHNALTFPAILIGFSVSFLLGREAMGASLKGFGLGLVCLLPLFLMGGIGGGDVKLLAAVGAIGGYPYVLRAIIYMALIGGLMAFAAMLWKKRAGESVEELKLTIPYGVAIGAGSLVAVFLKF